ncbi:hypothetical protein MPSEU_000655700 [Mayamaea pseudoterrestris]|nr:hypothetical protein MPSEU_000655700 [Mayamaea pseudoterrestris]
MLGRIFSGIWTCCSSKNQGVWRSCDSVGRAFQTTDSSSLPNSSPMVWKNAYQTFDWKPLDEIPEDENWMDLLLLVTRSSKLKQGSMACILVQPMPIEDTIRFDSLLSDYMSRIASIGTNQSLYSENSSDIHAEIVAIGQAARRKQDTTFASPTEGCTAYITMPPCRNCFAALYVAGIRRIVSRYECKCQKTMDAAHEHNIEMDTVVESLEQRDRIKKLVKAYESRLGDDVDDENGLKGYCEPSC